MSDKFQPDFYVTCATVIPVLFLALAVQGNVFESVLRASKVTDAYAWRGRLRRTRRGPKSPERTRRWQRTREELAWAAGFALYIYALFLLFAGTVGEGFALYVLYRGSPLGSVRGFLFVATTLLAVTVAAGPLLAFMRLDVGGAARAARRQMQASKAEPTEDQHREPETGTGHPPYDGIA